MIKLKTFVLFSVLAASVACSSCKTGAAPDGGTGGIGTVVVHDVIDCAEKATHAAALGILDDVSTALVTMNWEASLAKLVGDFGQAAVSCAVQEIGGSAAHAFQASGDPLSKTKADRARMYLTQPGHFPGS